MLAEERQVKDDPLVMVGKPWFGELFEEGTAPDGPLALGGTAGGHEIVDFFVGDPAFHRELGPDRRSNGIVCNAKRF